MPSAGLEAVIPATKLSQTYDLDSAVTGIGHSFKSINSFTGAYSSGWTFGLPFRGFLITYIQRHTVGLPVQVISPIILNTLTKSKSRTEKSGTIISFI
jgi:hypothetical protein